MQRVRRQMCCQSDLRNQTKNVTPRTKSLLRIPLPPLRNFYREYFYTLYFEYFYPFTNLCCEDSHPPFPNSLTQCDSRHPPAHITLPPSAARARCCPTNFCQKTYYTYVRVTGACTVKARHTPAVYVYVYVYVCGTCPWQETMAQLLVLFSFTA